MGELSTLTENVWLSETSNGALAIDRLFNRLDILYPVKWRNQFPNESYLKDFKQSWAEELHERGVTFSEVKDGLNRCIEKYKDWPPNFAQFLECCRPEIDYEAAFYESVEQMRLRETGNDTWSNNAFYWASIALGCDINNFPYQSIKSRWKIAVDDSNAKIEKGELPNEIPKILTALPAPEKAHTMPKEKALEILAEMKRVIESKIVR